MTRALTNHNLSVPAPAGEPPRGASTEIENVHELAWGLLVRVPDLTMTKSKTVVPLFCRFLCSEFFSVHSDDPDW